MPLIKRVNKADDIVFQYWQRIDWTSYPRCYIFHIGMSKYLKNVQLSMDQYKEFFGNWLIIERVWTWGWNKVLEQKLFPRWNDKNLLHQNKAVGSHNFYFILQNRINQWYLSCRINTSLREVCKRQRIEYLIHEL